MLTDDGRAGVLRIGGDIAADELSLPHRHGTAADDGWPRRRRRAGRSHRHRRARRGCGRPGAAAPAADRHDADDARGAQEDKTLLGALRGEIQRHRPVEEPIEPIELRRVTLRGLVTVVGGGVAAYLILTQLAQLTCPKSSRARARAGLWRPSSSPP